MSELMDKLKEFEKVRDGLRSQEEHYKYSTSSAGPAYRAKIDELSARKRQLQSEIDELVAKPIEQPKTEAQPHPS